MPLLCIVYLLRAAGRSAAVNQDVPYVRVNHVANIELALTTGRGQQRAVPIEGHRVDDGAVQVLQVAVDFFAFQIPHAHRTARAACCQKPRIVCQCQRLLWVLYEITAGKKNKNNQSEAKMYKIQWILSQPKKHMQSH